MKQTLPKLRSPTALCSSTFGLKVACPAELKSGRFLAEGGRVTVSVVDWDIRLSDGSLLVKGAEGFEVFGVGTEWLESWW